MGNRIALAAIVGMSLALPAWAQPSLAPTVTAVEIHLPAGANEMGLSDLIAVRRGQRLSVRAVRRSIERLMATGKFADVVVTSRPEAEGVRIAFELSLPVRVGEVRFVGHKVLPEATLREGANLESGSEFHGEKLARAESRVTALYRAKGYAAARVSARADVSGATADVTLQIDEGPPTRVLGVTATGAGLATPELLAALGIELGDVLDQSVLASGVERLKALYRTRRYYRARVAEPQIVPMSGSPGGAQLVLPVESGPVIDIVFLGARAFKASELRAVLAYTGEELLDAGTSLALARKLEGFYRSRGFFSARVVHREQQTGPGRAELAFLIEEGPPVRVGAIDFAGNREKTDSALQQRLLDVVATYVGDPPSVRLLDDPLDVEGRTHKPLSTLPPPPIRSVFVEDAYVEGARRLEETYRADGFLSATVKLDRVDVDVESHVARVRFAVTEGQQSRVRAVRFPGLPEGFTAPRTTGLEEGAPLRPAALEAARFELTRALGEGGWLFAQVQPRTSLSREGAQAEVILETVSGPKVRTGKVIIQGLELTQENLVRAHVRLKPGDFVNPEALFESQRQLLQLGLFRQVAVRLLAPDQVESTKDVIVEVRERSRFFGEVGGGYSLADGPRLIADATYPNLFGIGLGVVARGKINYVGASDQLFTEFFDDAELRGVQGLAGRGTLSLQQPRIYALLPIELSARLDLVAERVLRRSFRFTRFAAIAGVSWAATRWLDIGLSYEIERDQVQAARSLEQLRATSVGVDAERLRFPQGIFALQTVAQSISADFRDDRSNPTRGALVSFQSEFTGDLGATLTDSRGRPIGRSLISTFKASANVTGYIPLGGNVVLALSARAGRIFRLDPASTTIAPKRFFLGGATSMRGFREDGLLPADRRADLEREVEACQRLANRGGCTSSALTLLGGNQLPSEGGELFTLGKMELRIPLPAAFALGLFGEVGNLWLNPRNYRPLEFRYVAGIGIRYVTPVGPLALDLGFNVVPDGLLNENNPNIQFSVGLF
ncbi:MAG: POTRA domain-containing protein [Myxococcaceae bacterium]